MKTALVTGGNKGIGFAACKALAERGFHVFLSSRDEARGKKACEALSRSGKMEWLALDVSDECSIEKAVEALTARAGHLDALVNNAGIYIDHNDAQRRQRLSSKTREDIEQFTLGASEDARNILETFVTNTLGPFLLTRALAPLLAKAKGAQVINLSSGMGQLSDMGGGAAAYRISKAALNAVTRVLAAELADKRIRVNSISPGWVKTDMGGPNGSRTPEQGADTIVWLAEGGAGDATGGFYQDRKPIPW